MLTKWFAQVLFSLLVIGVLTFGESESEILLKNIRSENTLNNDTDNYLLNTVLKPLSQATFHLKETNDKIDFIDYLKDGSQESSEEDRTTATIMTTTSAAHDDYSRKNNSTGRLILMIVLGLSLPIAFLVLLFWRLHKEKKYLNRAGALVYQETVLVPTYTYENPGTTAENNNSSSVNITPMYTTLYDTPPDYDDAVIMPKATMEIKNKVENFDDASPPPAYTSVHL